MKCFAFLFIANFAFEHSLFAQNSYNFAQFRDETFDFIKQPAKWEGNDWLRLGLIGAGTFLAMQADQPIRDAVMKDRCYENNVPLKFGKFWGGPYPTTILAGAFGLHGLLADDRSSRKIGFELVQAALYSGGITTVLKVVFGRARPYTDKGSTEFRPFTFFDDGFHGLPSGHSTWAFALSTVLSRNAHSGALKVLSYIPAALTLVSRAYDDEHWASDSILGALIGFVVATWVVDLHEQKEAPVEISSFYPLTIRINLN
jgi:hypothetical protein